MRNRFASGLTLLLAFTVAFAPGARAVGLDTLIASGGTVTQGPLVFSSFGTSLLTNPATVDVSAITSPTGAIGLRFSAIPAGTAFSAATTGNARELVVDASFAVTVTGTSSLIHGVQQSLDSAMAVNGNAILYTITGIPAGAPSLSLFDCVVGQTVPSGQNCVTHVDSAVLPSDTTSLTVDRQIQFIVGQKNGTVAGDASTGFFDVTFSLVPACSPLTQASVSTTGSTAPCAGTTGGTATVTDTGGGASAHQWGFRTTTGGPITPIAQAGTSYLLNSADFGGAGSFFLVCTTTPTCGAPLVSNEVAVTVAATPATPVITETAGTNPSCTGSSVTLDAGAGYTGYLWSTGATTRTITVSPTVTTAYTVTGSTGSCTSAPGTFTQTIAAAPATPVIIETAGTNPSCTGSPITLDAGAGYTGYLWSTGATTRTITASPTVTTAYTVTGSTGSCTSAPGTFTQTVSVPPTVPSISAPASASPNTPNLMASVPNHPGSSYAWGISGGSITSGQGSSQVIFYSGAPGTVVLTVVETIGAGCTSAQASVTIAVVAALSVFPLAAPTSAPVDAPIAFEAGAAGGTLPYAFSWTFSDGQGASNEQNPSRSFPLAGMFTATVIVTDARGSQASGSVEVIVLRPGDPLALAVEARPHFALTGSEIEFDATPSGGSGTYASLTWDFGDDSTPAEGARVRHAFARADVFTVRCVVRDSRDATQSASATVTVSDGSMWLVPGVVYASGQGGAEWRSDLSIFNPDPVSSLSLQVAFLDGNHPLDKAGDLEGAWKTVLIPARATSTQNNVLASLFGLPAGNYGALLLRVDPSVSVPPVVTGSTYDVSRGAAGTVGLSLPAIPIPAAAASLTPTGSSSIDLIGLRDDPSHHTNFALANLSAGPATADITFLGRDGRQLGSTVTMQLGPYDVRQLTNALTIPVSAGGAGYDAPSSPAGTYRARVQPRAGTLVFPYASVIDDGSKDPILVPAARAASSYRLPGVVRTNGRNGTVWRSDVVLANPSATSRNVRLTFSSVDGNGAPRNKDAIVPLAAGEVLEWIDFVKVWLGLSDGDAGSISASFLDVQPADSSTDPLLVMARTYNDQPAGDVGLGIPGFTEADSASSATANARLVFAGLRSDTDFRSNVALFLSGPAAPGPATATLTVYDDNGVPVVSVPIRLDASREFTQISVDDLLASLGRIGSGLTIVIDNLAGSAIAGYATVVDNRSGDGTLAAGLPVSR